MASSCLVLATFLAPSVFNVSACAQQHHLACVIRPTASPKYGQVAFAVKMQFSVRLTVYHGWKLFNLLTYPRHYRSFYFTMFDFIQQTSSKAYIVLQCTFVTEDASDFISTGAVSLCILSMLRVVALRRRVTIARDPRCGDRADDDTVVTTIVVVPVSHATGLVCNDQLDPHR